MTPPSLRARRRRPSRVTDRPWTASVLLMPSAFAPSLGGVEELTAKLASELPQAGVAASVLTMRWPRGLRKREVISGVTVARELFCLPDRDARSLLRFALRSPSALAGTLRAARQCRADVVHVQCLSANGLYGWLAARLLGVPFVLSLQGELTMDATQVYQRSWALPRLLRHLMRHADAVTACSAATLEEAESFTGVTLGSRGRVVYNGVQAKELAESAPARRPRPYILLIGRHVAQKGFDVAIRAFAAEGLSANQDLVIAGDGPERATLEALSHELGVASSVHFVGRCDRAETAALFKGCDFFVLPSRHEPMGIVNLEAMAAGKAVVASAVGGVPEIVLHDETGLLVKPGDVAALARALRQLVDRPSLRDAFGEAGRRRAAMFDWPVIALQYRALYREVANLGVPEGAPLSQRSAGPAHPGTASVPT